MWKHLFAPKHLCNIKRESSTADDFLLGNGGLNGTPSLGALMTRIAQWAFHELITFKFTFAQYRLYTIPVIRINETALKHIKLYVFYKI